jgi:hypothetical protein
VHLNIKKQKENLPDKEMNLLKTQIIDIFDNNFLFYIFSIFLFMLFTYLSYYLSRSFNISYLVALLLSIVIFVGLGFRKKISKIISYRFDINDDVLRERKLKFIEIVLIVGGIIGSIQLKNENYGMNIVFGLFLIGSILYYFSVSNKIDSKSIQISVIITAPSFSAIAIMQFFHKGMPLFYGVSIFLLFIALAFLIGSSLYLGRRKEIEKLRETP